MHCLHIVTQSGPRDQDPQPTARYTIVWGAALTNSKGDIVQGVLLVVVRGRREPRVRQDVRGEVVGDVEAGHQKGRRWPGAVGAQEELQRRDGPVVAHPRPVRGLKGEGLGHTREGTRITGRDAAKVWGQGASTRDIGGNAA